MLIFINDYNVLFRSGIKEKAGALIMAITYEDVTASPHDDESNFNDIYIDFN